MRGRQPQEVDLFGLKFTFTPLPFKDSQPLLPEVGEIISIALREFGHVIASGAIKMDEDVIKLLPALAPIFSHFQGGRLDRLAPKLLASTTVVMPDLTGERRRYELIKEADRNEVFDEYPECYMPAVFLAGRRTYARFFPESVLRALAARSRKASSTPTGSSPSTSRDPAATG